MEIRSSPSEIRSTPLAFNTRDAGSSQSTTAIDISGDQVTATSGNSSVTSSRSLEEDKGTCGRISIVVLESIGGGLPVNEGGIESTCRASISQTNKVIAQSSVFRVIAVGQVSFSPGNGFRAGSGVSKTMSAVSTGSGDAAAGRIASTSGDESTRDVSSLGGDMIPDIGSARVAADSLTSSLTVNVEFSASANGANE